MIDLTEIETGTPELGVIDDDEDENENETTPVESRKSINLGNGLHLLQAANAGPVHNIQVDGGEEPLQRLPKSTSSFDLRSRAQTPKPSEGKLGLSRESLIV